MLPLMASATGNADQTEYWNGERGQAWVARADQFDAQLEVYALKAVAALAPQPGDTVIDIGCGAGATTIEAARAVGSHGRVVGMDISAPMLALARSRVASEGFSNVDLVEADAQTAAPPLEHPATGAVSRFGVMFFEDPVAAFANIARMIRPEGRFAFVCWAEPQFNEWITEPSMAVADIVPPVFPEDPLAPGPFAFADAERVERLLEDAGWVDILVEDVADPLYLGGPGSVEHAVDFVLGGTAMAGPLAEEGPETVAKVQGTLRALFTPQHDGVGVRYPALARLFTAHRGD